MTIERLAQFTAETRVLTDVSEVSGQNTVEISSAVAKTGTYSYRVTFGDAAMGKALVIPKAAARLGYWLYMVSAGINALNLIYFAGAARVVSNSTNHIRITYNSGSGQLELVRPLDNTDYEVLDSCTLPSQFATTSTWFHVGVTHKIDDVDGFFSLYINGTSVLNFIGDTRPSHYTSSTRFFSDTTSYVFGAGGYSSGTTGLTEAHIDDMFIDSYEGEVDSPVPSRRFLMVLPTGAGADAAWTPVPVVANYLNVDDSPNDGEATIVKALSADLRDTYAMGDITLPVDHRIVAAIPTPFVKRLDSEIQHLLSVHFWDGVQYADSPDLDLSMSFDTPVFHRFTTQPDGSDWNETDFNAMMAGARSRGVF